MRILSVMFCTVLARKYCD